MKTANSEKCVFRVLRLLCCLGLQTRFPPKTCSRCLQCSEIRFLPRNQPAELVTCRGAAQSQRVSNAAARISHRRCHRSLTRQPVEAPGRLPVQNGAFRPKNGLTAMSPLRHRSCEKRSRKSNLAPHQSRIGAWCGPGAGLAILVWAQDCPNQSCCGRRIASLNPVATAGLPGALPAALAWSRSCQSAAL